MAKLPRVTAKVFASNAPQDKIGQFGSAKAGTKVNTSDISTIQGLPAFTTGWTEAVVQGQNFPTLEEMNGLQKVFSQQIAYLFEQGIPEYDSNTTYYVGSICKVSTANSLTFYVSKVDNNLGNTVTNTSYWEAYSQNRTFTSKTVDIGIGTTSLSSYLPADGQYLVGVYCDVDVERRGRNQATVQTDIFPKTAILSSSGSTDDSSWATAFVWVPVGGRRTITIACTSSYNSLTAKLVGYMKI